MSTKTSNSGFAAETAAASPNDDRFASAVAVKDMNVRTVYLEDYQEEMLQGIVPELPIGIYVKNEADGFDRLQTIKFREDIDLGAYEMSLGKLEKRTNDPAKAVVTIAKYLATAVESIGGLPLTDIAKRLSLGDKTFQIFERMYLPDLFSAVIGAKIYVTGFELAVVGVTCPCNRKEKLDDTDKDNLHSLKRVETKVLGGFESTPPIFVVDFSDLTRKFSDGTDEIKRLYLEPLKAFQLGRVISSKSDAPDDIKTIQEVVTGIPDSTFYSQVKGNPLKEELYERMPQKHREMLMEAVGELEFGPKNSIEVECFHCGMEKVDYPFPWVRNPRYFVYQSRTPAKQ